MERLIARRFVRSCVCGALAAFAMSAGMPNDASGASRKPAKTVAVLQCPSTGTRSIGFAKAVDGITFLTTDGKEVRLAGVLAPGSEGKTPSSATSDTARHVLESALRSGALTLAADGPPDRYGRIVAEVFADGTWVQAKLAKAGALRVMPDAASAPCARQLLAAEDEGRAMHSGHWSDGVFSLRTPEQLRDRVGSFQIVEGTVTTATAYKGRTYINFGADYRTDFTVTVAPADVKLFRTARFDVKALSGKRVRVRGWVELYNGPEMEIATPAAIEILDDTGMAVVSSSPARRPRGENALRKRKAT
jgi:endonuclease YncB( thermonuclease family)